MKRKLVEFTALMLAALVAGVFWGTWFTLTRSLEDFSPAEFIHIGKTIIRNVALPMRILMPATLLLILLAVVQNFKTNKASFYWYGLSLLLMIASLIITVTVEVPIDNQIKTWTAETIPNNWQALRQTWNQFHTLRTITSVAGLGCFTIGLLNRVPK